jgi:hypothetical protein
LVFSFEVFIARRPEPLRQRRFSSLPRNPLQVKYKQ